MLSPQLPLEAGMKSSLTRRRFIAETGSSLQLLRKLIQRAEYRTNGQSDMTSPLIPRMIGLVLVMLLLHGFS